MDWDDYDRQLAHEESYERVDSCPFIEWEAAQSDSNNDDDCNTFCEDIRYEPPAPRNKGRILVCYSESSEDEEF